jgi:hypothetical protein
MSYRNQIKTGYLLNNADVLNKIILDRISRHGASDLDYQLVDIADSDHVFACTRYENNCPQNTELMEQMQHLQSVIDLLVELRR